MLATIYAITIPLKGFLNLFDTVVLIGIFIWYITIIIRKPVENEEIEEGFQGQVLHFRGEQK